MVIWNTRLAPNTPASSSGRAPAPTAFTEEEKDGAQTERPSKGYSLRRHLRALAAGATDGRTGRRKDGDLEAARARPLARREFVGCVLGFFFPLLIGRHCDRLLIRLPVCSKV